MINCIPGIIGVKSILLSENLGVTITRPDIATEDEINVTYPTIGTTATNSPTWERVTEYSSNFKKQFTDTFKFYLYGINTTTRATIQTLRTNRNGFLTEITLKNGSRLLFQSPVFVSKVTNKQDDLRTWEIELSYRKPTFLDKLKIIATKYYFTQFNGVNENVDCGSDGSINFDTKDSFSVSGWYYFNNISNQLLFSKQDITTADNTGYYTILRATGKVAFARTVINLGVEESRIATDLILSSEQWYHIAVTTSGVANTTGMNIYVNGVVQTTSIEVDTLGAGSMLNTGDLIIAGRADLTVPLNGDIDEVSIYGSELTASNTLDIYNLGRRNPNLTNYSPVSHWRMDAINPPDMAGTNNGTGVNIDGTNIIEF